MNVTRHDDLPLTCLEITPPGADADASLPLVFVLHGRGADANDLADLAPLIGGSFRFLFPNAPKPFEVYPGMSYGFTWFDGWPAERNSIVASRKLLLEFIDEALRRFATPAGKVVISGFSQGGLMSIDAGFRTDAELAGIVVMSGALYEEDAPNFSTRNGLPVFMGHGLVDDVIPINEARRARRVLEEQGVDVEYHEYPIGHHVSEESMAAVGGFIRRVLGG